MSPSQINVAIAELLGWRRWTFDDKLVVGLKLSDNRFGGFKRVVTKVEPYILLNIDEGPSFSVESLRKSFTPISHWVDPMKQIRVDCPNFHGSLDACAQFRKKLSLEERGQYCQTLYTICDRMHRMAPINWLCIDADAPTHCEAFLRLKGKWLPKD